jgi:serine/threonine protein kinase
VQIPDHDIFEQIGQGHTGVVFRARQVSLGRAVALKLLRGSAATPQRLARFHRETEALARLDHPGIVPVYETGEVGGHPYFTMQLIEGADLGQAAERLRTRHDAVMAVIAQVARALHHAHERGILHRDLKPSNIVLDGQDCPHLVDFSTALDVEEASDLTSTGVILGSPAYLSPEQAAGRKEITPASEVFSLGVILYELLTGRLPFMATTPFATALAVIQQPVTPPRRLNRSVSRWLEKVCMKCLEREPKWRYQTALELAEDLESSGQQTPARRTAQAGSAPLGALPGPPCRAGTCRKGSIRRFQDTERKMGR